MKQLSAYTINYSESTAYLGLLRWDKFIHSATRIGAKLLGIKYVPFSTCPENIELEVQTKIINATLERTDIDSQFISGFSFDANDYRFGGWSGFDIDSHGKIVAVSDEGFGLKADPVFGEKGDIVGFEKPIFSSLKGQDGKALSGKMFTDAEDIAILPNGQLAVSFERDHRVLIYNDLLEPAVDSIELPKDMLDAFETFTQIYKETGNSQYGNVGIESLAVVDGHLMAVIEEALPTEAEHRVYMQNDMGGWDNMYYQGLPDYGISSATTLPNGNVLFLERATHYFTGYEHYDCRIVEIDKNNLFLGNHFTGNEWLRFDSKTADNFESIFTYKNAAGETYVGITTDDNYAWSERNLFLNFKWDDTLKNNGQSMVVTDNLEAPEASDVAYYAPTLSDSYLMMNETSLLLDTPI